MGEDWLSSLIIYYDNLSNYYIFCIIVSLGAVMMAWWVTKFNFKTTINENTNIKSGKFYDRFVWTLISIVLSDAYLLTVFESRVPEADIVDEEDGCDAQDGSLLAKLKVARQEAIVQCLSASLTEEQLEEERETEKQQLKAIFELLQKQGEKFQVGSMEELEDQLRLYRR